jgi:hypothetical protein
MSHSLQKITYECDCGKNYGSCGEQGVFYMDYNAAIDLGTVYHKPHPDEKMLLLGSFTDIQLSALIKILSTNDGRGSWTPKEIEEIKEARGW